MTTKVGTRAVRTVISKWNSPKSPNVHITPITTIKIELK
jgi:hypothetical protein